MVFPFGFWNRSCFDRSNIRLCQPYLETGISNCILANFFQIAGSLCCHIKSGRVIFDFVFTVRIRFLKNPDLAIGIFHSSFLNKLTSCIRIHRSQNLCGRNIFDHIFSGGSCGCKLPLLICLRSLPHNDSLILICNTAIYRHILSTICLTGQITFWCFLCLSRQLFYLCCT